MLSRPSANSKKPNVMPRHQQLASKCALNLKAISSVPTASESMQGRRSFVTACQTDYRAVYTYDSLYDSVYDLMPKAS
jgi:hypothetical protein